jgi:hypothetical protein
MNRNGIGKNFRPLQFLLKKYFNKNLKIFMGKKDSLKLYKNLMTIFPLQI